MTQTARLGRPTKYGRPARAVTVTLPEDTLARLSAIHADVGSAIVRLVDRRATARVQPVRAAEISQYGNHAVIVVTPVRALKRLRGVELVPIGDGRALISLMPPMSISALELQVRDAAERDDVHDQERQVLRAIADILRRGRATRHVVVEPRTIIVLVSRSRRGVGSSE